MIRKSYFAPRPRPPQDNSTTKTRSNDENDDNESDKHQKHILHCLDYLRLSLQCHADTNLEYRVISPTSSSSSSSGTLGDGKGNAQASGFTGYGEHRCRDFERVFRFAEEWRVFEGKDEKGRRGKVGMRHG